MYLIMIQSPLIGGIVTGLFGRKLGVSGSQFISTICVGTSTIVSIICYFEVGISSSPVILDIMNWFQSQNLSIRWEFLFDSLSMSMIVTVLIISTIIHIFSIDYMSSDPHNQRFFCYLNLFTFFMILLISANNYLLLFVGWEFISILSFLLINFWFTWNQANKSAMKAMFINRIGDMFLTVGFFLIYFVFGTLDYTSVFILIPWKKMITENIEILGIMILLGSMAKSAQIGFHIWLPNSMVGPTPVSALIHAATLVTAGVYLLMRSSPILEYASNILIITMWIGCFTAFFASFIGIFQNDIKRIIAYSTSSQMGYLFIACGISQYNFALFHLINHAFFKALLFMATASLIHVSFFEQDQRKFGGFIAFSPFIYVSVLIGGCSLIAFPFLTGYYSKDMIIEISYSQYQFHSIGIYLFVILSAVFTSIYTIKYITLQFYGYANASKTIYKKISDINPFSLYPLVILSVFSIFVGYCLKEQYTGIGSDYLYFDNSISQMPVHNNEIDNENQPVIYKQIPICLSILMGVFTFIFYIKDIPGRFLNKSKHNQVVLKAQRHHVVEQSSTTTTLIPGSWCRVDQPSYSRIKIYRMINKGFYMDVLNNKYNLTNLINHSQMFHKYSDKGIIELIGPFGAALFISSLNKDMKTIENQYDNSILNDNQNTQNLYFYFTLLYIFILFTSTFFIDSRIIFVYIFAIFYSYIQIDNHCNRRAKFSFTCLI